MSVVIFVLQEKGGTRKTWTVAHLAVYLARNGVDLQLIEADVSPGHLMKVRPDAMLVEFSPREIYDDGQPCDLEKIYHLIHDKKNVLVDFGSNIAEPFYEFFMNRTSLETELQRAGAKAIFIVPVTRDPKTHEYFVFYKKHFPFATVLLAEVAGRSKFGFTPPAHDEGLTFEVPQVSEFLLSFYCENHMTMDRVGETYSKGTDLSTGIYARGALQSLFNQFDKVKSHLLPTP